MPTVSNQTGRAASKARTRQVNSITNDIMSQLEDKSGITNTNNAISMDTSTIHNDLTALAFTTDLTGMTFGDYEELSATNALAVISTMPPPLSETSAVPVNTSMNVIITSESDVLWTTYLRSLE